MFLPRSVYIFFFTLSVFLCPAQDYFFYGGGNYSGLSQVFANPGMLADNRLKYDIILSGLDVNFNNSWFKLKREALDYNGSLFKPSTLHFPLTWKNHTPGVPDNLFKNFEFLSNAADKSLLFESRILLPSVMYQVNEKNTFAFTWSLRQMCSINGISDPLAYIFEKELDLSVTQNNRVVNKNLAAVQMSWAEYGFTYARVISNKQKHFFKAGITPKILQGLEGIYLIARNLDFLFSTKDTLSYFRADFSYARSANLSGEQFKTNPVRNFYHYVSAPRLGLDLGLVYEWRPQWQKFRYRPDGSNYTWRRDLNKYKFRIGASVCDWGKIKFSKQGKYYELNSEVNRSNFQKFYEVKSFEMFDSLVRADFASEAAGTQFAISLPTAINVQTDYLIKRFLYLAAGAHITSLGKSNLYRVSNANAFYLAPRIEHYWFDVSLPVSYNGISARRSRYFNAGITIRLGPLVFGSNNIIELFEKDKQALNFFVMLKCAIPHKLIYDQDKDGVKDRNDNCPDDKGVISLNGCPDKDGDLVTDKDDQCPGQAGLAALGGCPDTDGDGIKDGEDNCPKDKGVVWCRGCPDADRDSISDKEDACPQQAGTKTNKGCPDSDGDGTVDKSDPCPRLAGPAEYKGCPDTDGDLVHDGIDACLSQKGPAENKGCPWPDSDKDGIIDKLDSCITLPGIAQYKGCPPPAKLAPQQKRILEKAYSNLEFASGKDQIKASSYASLNELAQLLLSQKKDWKIKLSGHTDNVGSEAQNLLLSEKRARAVEKYLVSQGVPRENILVEWYGKSLQIADNNSKKGKQKNRRVEMVVITTEE